MKNKRYALHHIATALVLILSFSTIQCMEELEPKGTLDRLHSLNKKIGAWLKKPKLSLLNSTPTQQRPFDLIRDKIPFVSDLWRQVKKEPSDQNILQQSNIDRILREPPPEPFNLGSMLAARISPDARKQFLFGIATNDHLINTTCSAKNCSVARMLKQSNDLAAPLPTPLVNTDHHYESHLQYAQTTSNINAISFSISWPRVQPDGPGAYDEEALDHYAQLFSFLVRNDITPIISFHHFEEPCWFADLDSFEEEANIPYFINYCSTVYQHIMNHIAQDQSLVKALTALQPRTPLWASFNAPEEYASRAYIDLTLPPAEPSKQGAFWYCRALKNICQAHTRLYRTLNELHKKELELLPPPCIGLFKQMCPFDPAEKTLRHRLLQAVSRFSCGMHTLLHEDLLLTFFCTGTFSAHILGKVSMEYTNMDARNALDFIGINYFSNHLIYRGQMLQETDDERTTQNPTEHIYPEGLYRSIHKVAHALAIPRSIPIYITANGIATDDEQKRYDYYHRHLQTLLLAARQGYPILEPYRYGILANTHT